ncbi:acetate--CoA ligase family protein [Streptomyces sp. NPDC005356]|uniref:acetate--CoA ligase family protein n=1 Tax=Streptomyces sp. NPDC005356 TaxID=3157167 RepID=UPI0033A282CB
MSDSIEGVSALLAPRSIALVGASDDPRKASSRPLAFLRESGHPAAVYPVNARRDRVAGEKAWPSLRDLPEVPDHAFVMTPAQAAVDTVHECAELGVPIATVLSGGFAEEGPEGEKRQRELLTVAREGGVRLLGPSSLGVVDLRSGLRLTGNAVFAEPDLPVGGTFVASQSGSMIGALVSRGKARGIGFASVVSVGAEADLGIGEICAATLDDPSVTDYLLFLETIRHPQALADFARAAAERGKPVAAYKLGRSAAAAELARSHTGALAGEDDVASAFLAQCGIARLDTLEALFEAPALLGRIPAREPGRAAPSVGVVTTTGGGAAMVVDQLGVRGVQVAAPSAETRERLGAAGISAAEGALVDLTLAGTRPEVMSAALDVMLSAPEFDLVVAVVGSSARLNPELALQPVLEAASGAARLATFLVPDAPQALRRLTEAGVPSFRTPESCADAVASALARRTPGAGSRRLPSGTDGRPVDEAAGYTELAEAGLPVAPYAVIDPAAVELPPFTGPYAVKALDARLAHKSDAGGVVLGVGADGLKEAAARIVRQVAERRPGLSVDRVLVQPMIAGAGEALVGYRVDPMVGPTVLLAAGGTLTELYRDRSVRMAPVDEDTAQEMIDEVVALRALDGYRGARRGDLTALRDAVVAMSRLADRPHVREAEINPLVVLPAGQGVLAVDALVHLDDGN